MSNEEKAPEMEEILENIRDAIAGDTKSKAKKPDITEGDTEISRDIDESDKGGESAVAKDSVTGSGRAGRKNISPDIIDDDSDEEEILELTEVVEEGQIPMGKNEGKDDLLAKEKSAKWAADEQENNLITEEKSSKKGSMDVELSQVGETESQSDLANENSEANEKANSLGTKDKQKEKSESSSLDDALAEIEKMTGSFGEKDNKAEEKSSKKTKEESNDVSKSTNDDLSAGNGQEEDIAAHIDNMNKNSSENDKKSDVQDIDTALASLDSDMASEVVSSDEKNDEKNKSADELANEIEELTNPSSSADELESGTDSELVDEEEKQHKAKSSSKVESVSSENDSLLNEDAKKRSEASLRELMEYGDKKDAEASFAENDLGFRSGTKLEDLVVEAMKPQLSAWLNENLPDIVENLVKQEIKRIVPKGRNNEV